MKKTFFVLLIPLTLLLLQGLSCSKPTRNEWQTVVNGRAVESNTTVPVTGAKVQLFAGSSTKQEAVTDAEGKFHFEFIASPGTVYTVFVTPDTVGTKKRYFDTRLSYIDNGEINTFDYQVTPYAYLKIHLKNVNPLNDRDKVNVSSPFPLGQSFSGANVDTTIVDYASSNDTIPIVLWVYRNGVGVVHRRDRYLPAHDTTFLEFLY